jgi:hypothetical protein
MRCASLCIFDIEKKARLRRAFFFFWPVDGAAKTQASNIFAR